MNEREKIIRLWFDMWIKKADFLRFSPLKDTQKGFKYLSCGFFIFKRKGGLICQE